MSSHRTLAKLLRLSRCWACRAEDGEASPLLPAWLELGLQVRRGAGRPAGQGAAACTAQAAKGWDQQA